MPKRRGKRSDVSNKKPRTESNKDYADIMKENAMFEAFYKAQNIVPEEEWPQFLEACRRELPIAFRITGFRGQAIDIKNNMEKIHFTKLDDVEIDGVKIQPPHPIPWYPNQLAWQYEVGRMQVRKMPQFKQLQAFLVSENEVGNISRQEAVSMIPPLLLDVQPNHHVMDMCAAPGSKTSQIVEMIHAGVGDNQIPDGLVIANDADNKRSYMLVKQMKRLASPCLVVTNHDAGSFPPIKLADTTRLKFDRILADVPCTGDGTMRKNPAIWRSWNINNATGLHPLQVRILERGCQLLKVGGRIVFSTCSFNPIENEAVVAEILRQHQGCLELADVSNELPGLKRSPGLSTWTYMNKKQQFFKSIEEVPENLKTTVRKSYFCPTEEEASWMHLERCIRIVPHAQNTGGFFVAVLQKVKPLSNAEVTRSEPREDVKKHSEQDVEADKSSEEHVEEEANESKRPISIPPGKNKGRIFKEEPFLFLKDDAKALQQIKAFWKPSAFPSSQWLVRSEGDDYSSIYFVSKSVKQVLETMELNNLKVINSGIKAFGQNTLKKLETDSQPEYCPYRLHHEIVQLIQPHIDEARVVEVTANDLLIGLRDEFPQFDRFSPQVSEALRSQAHGGLLFRFDPEKHPKDGEMLMAIHAPVILSVWRAHTSVNVLLAKAERCSLLMRLFGVERTQEIMSDRQTGKTAVENNDTADVADR